ncbi:MAG: anti-anti-sigma regulatory factor, partial [Polyangiales bacterium]
MKTRALSILLLATLIACGDDDTTPTPDAGAIDAATVDSSTPDAPTPPLGDLTVVLEAEDTITEGIGTEGGDEIILDGWSVDFDRYIVTIGDIDVHRSTDESIEVEAADVFVVDLTQVPASGRPLWSLDGLEAGRWEF